MQNFAIKNGLILGGVTTIAFIISYFVPQIIPGLGFIVFLIDVFFIRKAILEHRDSNGGFISFGNAFSTGFLTFVVGVLIPVFTQFVITNYILTDYNEKVADLALSVLDWAENTLEESGQATDEQFDQLEQTTEILEESKGQKTSLASSLMGYFMKLLFVGLPTSLISAAILKKERNEFA